LARPVCFRVNTVVRAYAAPAGSAIRRKHPARRDGDAATVVESIAQRSGPLRREVRVDGDQEAIAAEEVGTGDAVYGAVGRDGRRNVQGRALSPANVTRRYGIRTGRPRKLRIVEG